MQNLIQKNTKIYDSFYKNNDIDGWDDADKRLNFYYLFKIFDNFNIIKHKPSILDVGCGTGDMAGFLPVYKSYLGIDIYRPALKIAKKRYRDRKISFKYGNILTSRFKKENFDFVLSSGALSVNQNGVLNGPSRVNLRGLKHPNYTFLKQAVTKMWDACKFGLTFNVLVKGVYSKSNGNLFYYDKDLVLDICSDITNPLKEVVEWENTPLDRINPQITVWMWK